MSSELTEDQRNVLKAIVHNESFYSFDVQRATPKGEGYMGSLFNISLKGERNNLELIFKQAEPTDNVEHKMFVRNAYLREIYIYNNVLNQFENFQKENNVINGFTGYAKIYGSSDKENNEYIILENLKGSGYKMWNRKVPMDDEHVALVFSEYGKFHAVSLAMKEKSPDLYDKLTENLDDFYGRSMSVEESKEMINNVLQIGFKAVESNDSAAQLFKRFADVAEKFLLEDMQNLDEQLVVTHADCWCNNMLFKYEGTQEIQKPNGVCFIDWQLSKIGSPVLDLAYFFFVCTTGNILHDYKKYLKIYHDSVTELLIQFSCDVEKVFPFTLLECHWKKYAKFGLYIALMTLSFMLCETEVPNWTEFIKYEESDREEIAFEGGSGVSEQGQRIIDIINVMAQNNLI
ncbi:uncharacterized protein LOC108908700 [Anoplophora glabripennis]|uniref:uncharacterized protein LOC108908700 n=1 Tax=Anoplophora glabripennis TaxID=217634 RepID=UPI000874C8FD|nr:uncharacterized protein LOC108908700 [Anoplophora glabripennis]